MTLDLDALRATYDHPTDSSVIDLIDRLEQAEQRPAKQTSTVKTLAERNIELTERMRVLNVRFDAMRASRDSERSRADKNANQLKQAEAQVARGRELSKHMRECVPDGLIRRDDTAWRIDRALDGEPNE